MSFCSPRCTSVPPPQASWGKTRRMVFFPFMHTWATIYFFPREVCALLSSWIRPQSLRQKRSRICLSFQGLLRQALTNGQRGLQVSFYGEDHRHDQQSLLAINSSVRCKMSCCSADEGTKHSITIAKRYMVVIICCIFVICCFGTDKCRG